MLTDVSTDPWIWDRAECLPRESLAALQLVRLRATIARILDAQPAGAERLRTAGIDAADDIVELGDLQRLPFTSKSDVRAAYPFDLLAVPRTALARIQGSSGTGGKPTLVGYTRADLEHWTELMARCLTLAGVRADMMVHNANGYGLFTGGLGFHQGAERVGATVVPVSGGSTARQVTLLADLRPEALVATPSYALVLAQAIRDQGIAPDALALELGLFGGEPWGDGLRTAIEDGLGLRAINFYGLSELCGPGVAAECLVAADGLHVHEDHFIVEVVEPQSGQPVAPGTAGELVFTTLTKEAMPLIRYRTGDIGSVIDAPCACGRTTVRITGLRGRYDDWLIIRGVNLHPSEVEHVLLGIPGATPHHQLVLDRPGTMDEVVLECEPATAEGADDLRRRLEPLLKERTGLRIGVNVVAPGTLPRTAGKAVRVIDRRPQR